MLSSPFQTINTMVIVIMKIIFYCWLRRADKNYGALTIFVTMHETLLFIKILLSFQNVKYNVIISKTRMPAEFQIDWNHGYSLYDSQTNECLWRYRFSQLKGSSDDGISSLKLLFRDEKTGGIETRVSTITFMNILLWGARKRKKKEVDLNIKIILNKKYELVFFSLVNGMILASIGETILIKEKRITYVTYFEMFVLLDNFYIFLR